MAYNEALEARIIALIGDHPGLQSKKMFGGIGFLLNGNMACAVNKDYLIIRVGPDHGEEALAQPHTKPFDMTGRAMKGWVMVSPGGYHSDMDLEYWVNQGIKFSGTLPPK